MGRDLLVLTGPRVLLRLARRRDVPGLVAYYRQNRSFHAPWEPTRPRAFYTDAYWWRRVAEIRRDYRQDHALRLFVFRRDAPRVVIGYVGFFEILRGPSQDCYLGYSLARQAQGQGYMTEALRLAIAHAFGRLNLHRVMANYMPRNRRSGRVLRRLGFRIEGRARKYLRIAGKWEDHVMAALVNRAWRATAG